MKKLTLSLPSPKRHVDPLEIFKGLTLRGGIENIWEPQAEALKTWHKDLRKAPDVVVQMNTGGGKTLVGLLMAQSLVNETRGRVLYVCANNLLIEQTKRRSEEIGISPALRYGGNWINEQPFDRAEVFCLTNYHGLFNGRSVFRDDGADAIVFDDAHVAESAIRDCFTLRIPSDHEAFDDVANVFRRHFANTSRATHFDNVSKKGFTPVLFVPTFIVWQTAPEIRRILLKHNIPDVKFATFAWVHLESNLAECAVLMTGAELVFTATSLPLHVLPYFNDDTRRVYLTATLPTPASFARAFGVAKPRVVRPSGKSGDAQRLFVFVPGDDDDEQRENVKRLVKKLKTCVISPSTKKAKDWVPPAKLYDSDQGEAPIDEFRNSKKPEMLALVARYDGIDLPGKSCRVLVLDRLPRGESLLDRFIDEAVKVETIRLSLTATRIVQAIGRIFRSNTDHGVVMLVGEELQSWLRKPKRLAYLPALLQKQLMLGHEFSKLIDQGETTWEELVDGILTGDANWEDTYTSNIDQFAPEQMEDGSEWHLQLILQEREAYEDLWFGHPDKAANRYLQMAEEASGHDERLGAWYRHLCGLAYLANNDRSTAYVQYLRASNVRSELGRPNEEMDKAFKPKAAEHITDQAKRLATYYRTKRSGMMSALDFVDSHLRYGDETNKAEEATKLLGELLGLETQRPEKKGTNTGPDVVWRGNSGLKAWGFELKTNKKGTSEYTKKEDIGQAHDHEQWMNDKFGDSFGLAIVGRMLRVSKESNPSPSLRVIEVETMRALATRVRQAFDAVDGGEKGDLPVAFQTWLNFLGLSWPECVEALENRSATDLRATD